MVKEYVTDKFDKEKAVYEKIIEGVLDDSRNLEIDPDLNVSYIEHKRDWRQYLTI